MNLTFRSKWYFVLALVMLCSIKSISQSTLSIEGVGDFYAISALFGPSSKEEIRAQLVLVDDGVGVGSDACTGIVNDISGKIALIDRGACTFASKALNAQAAGAIAVLICNNDAQNPNLLPFIAGDDMGMLNIPVKGLTFGNCQTIKQALNAGVVNAKLLPAYNNLCFEALPIQPGTYTVDTIFVDPVLGGLGGAPSDPENASASVWYAYTPEESGLLTINSCLGGADTRLFLHTGSCDLTGLDLTRVRGNDDACPFEAGNDEDIYASNIEVPVRAGETYYIEWDNRWESKGFTFTLAFEPANIVLQPGQVCDSAIVIAPGTYEVDTIRPYGQSGFYNLNGSAWYSFTPQTSGLMSISSCGSGVDTRLLVFEGSCGNLTLASEDTSVDDVCPAFEGDDDDLAAAIFNFPVIAGITYLIEWSGQADPSGFSFTLSLDPLPTVPVTFQVDMALQTISPDGIKMVWAKSNADSLNDVQIVNLSDADGDKKYTATVPLSTLDTIGYAFVNGNLNSLSNVETVPTACGVASGFGFLVRPYIVSATDSTSVDVVCFGSCASCGPENCANPFVLISDDFEAYNVGALGPQSPNWTTWSGDEGGAEDGIVAEDFATSGTKSMKIEGNNGPQDVLLLLGDKAEGHYILRWNLYVPTGKSAYYNTQKFEETPGEEFGIEVSFNANGTGTLSAGATNAASFNYRQNQWISVIHYVDLDNDNIRLYIDGVFVYAWKASAQASEPTGTLQLGAIDFFPARGPHLFYVDDVYYAEIPAAAPGYYAHTAQVITAGTHTVPSLDCFGAGFQVRSNGNGRGGYWYEYTATADGYIRLGTCNNGAVDTRMWIFGGGIQKLDILGVNDDLCELTPGGDPYASYREVPVKSGSVYHILFDNPWENTGFDWFLELVPDALPTGDFCESAIAIQPGTITIDTLNGNAAVGGPSIGISASNSFTPYANSEWYSFTAPSDGSMNVYTCEVLPIRTAVYIYEGTCGIENLKLLARDPSGCDPSSPVRNLPVTAGKTYYIEWASKFDGARPGFDFILEFGNPVVNVTYQVDMTQLAANGELAPEGAYIAGEFNSFSPEKMSDTDGDNIFTITIPAVQGDTIEYGFYNGPINQEKIDTTYGGNCVFDVFGSRFVIVGKENLVLTPFCYGYCATCEAVTGIEKTELQGVFDIYPNPTDETLFVRYELQTPTALWIELSNALGQVVQRKWLSQANSGNESLDVSKLPSGWYALTIKNNKQQLSRRVMIK